MNYVQESLGTTVLTLLKPQDTQTVDSGTQITSYYLGGTF